MNTIISKLILITLILSAFGCSKNQESYYSTGELKAVSRFDKANEVYNYTQYTKEGSVLAEGSFDLALKKKGNWKYFDANGDTVKSGSFANDIKVGKWVYNRSGLEIEWANYSDTLLTFNYPSLFERVDIDQTYLSFGDTDTGEIISVALLETDTDLDEQLKQYYQIAKDLHQKDVEKKTFTIELHGKEAIVGDFIDVDQSLLFLRTLFINSNNNVFNVTIIANSEIIINEISNDIMVLD